VRARYRYSFMSSSRKILHLLRGVLRLTETPSLPKELARKQQNAAAETSTTTTAAAPTTTKTSNRNYNAAQSFLVRQFRESADDDEGADGGTGASSSADDDNGGKQAQNAGAAGATPPSLEARRRRKEAVLANYYQLLRDVRERGRLYELDSGAEVVLSPKEMSRRAAARAGLQLPLEAHDAPEEPPPLAARDKLQ